MAVDYLLLMYSTVVMTCAAGLFASRKKGTLSIDIYRPDVNFNVCDLDCLCLPFVTICIHAPPSNRLLAVNRFDRWRKKLLINKMRE